jgi:type I site-specific restriction endonuclease
VQDILLVGIECEIGNGEVQWKNVKECMLDTIGDMVGKVEKRARKLWIAQEMISKMDERRKWKNVNTEEVSRPLGGRLKAVATQKFCFYKFPSHHIPFNVVIWRLAT